MLQSYEDAFSLLSGDVPAVVLQEARDEAQEFADLMQNLQKDGVKVDPALAKKIISRVDKYLNPDPTGTFVVSAEKASVRWNWSTGRVSNTFPVVLSAGQSLDASVASQATGSMRGDLEMASLLLTADGRVSTLITVPFLSRKLSNVPVSSNLMFGNAQLPALLAQTFLALPTSALTISLKDLSMLPTNTVSAVFWGRRATDKGKNRIEQIRRAMLFSQFMHPYVIGPTSGIITGGGSTPGGPEIVLQPGQQITCRFDLGGADFDWRWILDDSTQSDGMEPNLTANILLGDAGTPLCDFAIPWRDFIASPTVAVVGMKQIGGLAGIAAASAPGPGSCWSMLVRRGTKLQVQFNNTNAVGSGITITLRPGLGGIALYAPSDLKALGSAQAGDVQNGGRS